MSNVELSSCRASHWQNLIPIDNCCAQEGDKEEQKVHSIAIRHESERFLGKTSKRWHLQMSKQHHQLIYVGIFRYERISLNFFD